ncbi:MAG: GLUG motif-containing protein [Candidatus Cloacimonadales bacterium]|nr:GLUG motif-containing protein [Candidatus Cloacimonadales bacterium]
MKKMVFILAVLISMVSLNGADGFANGLGTELNPYQVSSPAELNLVRNFLGSGYSTKYFKQTAIIDLTSYSNWTPIGSLGSPIYNSSFYGSYDGNDLEISNLTINRSTMDLGLFGVLKEGEIKNVKLVNCSVIGSNQRIGALVGLNKQGDILTCSSSGVVNGTGNYQNHFGGLIGRNEEGTVSNCYSTATVSGYYHTGGLIGNNYSGNVSSSYATGSVTGANQHTGGLIGSCSDSEIIFCYATGNVSSTRANVGGLIGDTLGNATSSSKVIQCYSTGNVSYIGTAAQVSYAGGLIGTNLDTCVSDCYSSASVTSTGTTVGGLVGRNHTQFYSSIIENCYSSGSVSGSSIIGGFAGANTQVSSPSSYIYTSFWNVETDGIEGNSSGDDNFGATGKTTAEMSTDALNSPSIYLNAGWDFKGESDNGENEIWNIGNGRIFNYPYFDWQYPDDPSAFTITHSTQSVPAIPDPDPIEFASLGVTIDFSGVSGATGSNDVTISKYIEQPTNLTGLIGSEISVSGISYLFTNNTGFTFTSIVQFLVSEISGVNTTLFAELEDGTATTLKMWKRSEYGTGVFTDQGFMLYNDGTDNVNNTADDFLYVAGINGFSEFAFSSDGDHPLPVILSSFYVNYENGENIIHWTTQSENDNLGFNLYRSDLANGFEEDNYFQINSDLISGMGTSFIPSFYSFTDEYLVFGDHTYYYWLQSVSTNGELELFDPVSIEIPLAGEIITVISEFTVVFENSGPVLSWTSDCETDNLGYFVHRSENQNGFVLDDYLQLNAVIIPGMGTTAFTTNYTFTDENFVIEGHTYYYWLQSLSTSSEMDIYGPVSLEIPIQGEIPTTIFETYLNPNYPNPFNPETTIEFNVKENEIGILSIYNLRGERILKETFTAGNHQYHWIAEGLASGIYFYKLTSPTTNMMRKMILLK